MMKLYHADNGLSSPVRYSHGIWWINHPALCKPTSGRFLVMRQSREACAGYMGYPPCKWIVNLFRYSGVLTTKCALSQAREELPYPSGATRLPMRRTSLVCVSFRKENDKHGRLFSGVAQASGSTSSSLE